MKKIGILTFHNAYNYGAFLQCFALQEVLKSLKYNNVEIVDYHNERICDSYRFFPKGHKSIKQKMRDCMKFILYGNKIKKRYKKFDNDIKNRLIISEKQYITPEEIEQISYDYSILIAGSDQIWNRKITGVLSDAYTLNFKNQDIKKISYAASIGDASLVGKYQNEYKEKISKINYISVREDSAKTELKKIIPDDISVVLDPTLLLSKDEWNKYVNDFKNEKYILAYVVAPDAEYMRIVNDLANKTNLKVIFFDIRNHGYKSNKKCESAYEKGPLDFIDYIKNAEYIVTTSFHATVFSIIFNKKFFIVPHKETGSRVTNLLEKLEIYGRIFSSYEEFKNINYEFETDWKKVDEKLEYERKMSIEWLKNAIEG